MFNFFRNRTLQVEITTACNLNCAICLRRSLERPDRFLSLDDFKRILEPGLFRYVGLHGWGEPLLNRQAFEIVKYARSKGVITNLTTNGTLLPDRTDQIFESGLEEIAIGIYDLDLLSSVLPNIENFVEKKNKMGLKYPKIYFDITIYQDNRDQVPNMIRLASDIGIEAVILHRLFNQYDVVSGSKCLSVKDEKDLFKEIRMIARSIKMELYLPKKHSYPCRIVKRSIFVTVDGKVTPCTYLPEEYLGDALQGNLKNILSSRQYRRFIKRMKEHPICSKCRW